MNTRIWIAAAAASGVMALAGCAGGPNEQLGTAGGAVAGGVLGHAIGGNTASTVGGAAIGGLVGNSVGRSADQRNNYYPNNGPTY